MTNQTRESCLGYLGGGPARPEVSVQKEFDCLGHLAISFPEPAILGKEREALG